MKRALTFQEIIMALERFWGERGCLIWQPHNIPVGAGTMNPATFLQVLGPEPWNVAYVEPSIRPADSRYGQNPNRMQRFYQYQVVLKPEPPNPQELYLQSLEALGIDCSKHDVRFVEDNWESPALGAWGLGWEVWLDGQEITQYTYFQQAGGFTTDPVAVEITYGLERIAMPLQGVRSFTDIEWAPGITYGDVLLQAEVEFSRYNLDHADVAQMKELFTVYERQVNQLLEAGLVLPAYDFVLLCSHTFNVLDARGAVGVTERAHFFNRMRRLARSVAQAWVRQREELGFPRLQQQWVLEGVRYPAPQGGLTPPAPTAPQTLLLEIGVEELPPSDLRAALSQLERGVPAMLADARLRHGAVRVTGTPRRLVVYVEDVAPRQPDEEEEIKGPPAQVAFDADGRPTPAAQGFARSQGVPVEALEVRHEGKKRYVVARVRRTGQPAGVVLADTLPKLVAGLNFDMGMRWNQSSVSFSRPIRWYVALLGGDIIPFEYAGVRAGRHSRGLRAFGAPALEIPSAGEYFRIMASQSILVDRDQRRQTILKQTARLAEEVGGRVPDDPDLLDEVTDLNECPHAIRGDFDPTFLELPAEVLIAVMKKHQRYFPVVDAATGKMLPHFIVIANGHGLDEGLVRAGNEEVLRARFTDARFFYQADTSRKLEDFLPRLETLTFQERLGSMRDKSRRLERLVPILADELGLGQEERAVAVRAAYLSKADLATQMVIEMTSLQGIMGREYALHSGEPPAVAQAIFEQYLPRWAGDVLPQTPPSVVLALADRLDSLIGLFAIGLVPSGSADPFGLRRAALGLVQIIIEHRLPLSLHWALRQAASLLPVECPDEALEACREFILGRLRGLLQEQGLRYDVVEAALAGSGDAPYRAWQVARELQEWVQREDWPQILAAYSRCVRIVRGQPAEYPLRPELLAEPASQTLYRAYQRCLEELSPDGGMDAFFRAFIPMIEPINRFFDDILVMTEEQALREARLGLLQRIAALPAHLADLSKLEGF
ncbi:MAG: glycine--tRNA ligase subunit beta [Anaerolineae bacterium]